MRAESRWILIVGAGLVVGLVLVLCVALVLAVSSLTTEGRLFGRYRSNGEQIYFTATSQRVVSLLSVGERPPLSSSPFWLQSAVLSTSNR